MSTLNNINDIKHDDCKTCGLFETFEDNASAWVNNLSAELIDPMWEIFLAVVGVWIVIAGIRLFLSIGKLENLVVNLFFVIIAATLLQANDQGLVKELFSVSLAVISGTSTAVFDAATGVATENGKEGISRLIFAAEQAIWEGPLTVGLQIMGTWSVTNFTAIIKGLVILIPFVLLIGLYLIQCVVALATVMIISALSPFLMMGFGFEFFRGMAVDAFRTIIGAIISLFSCTVVLSFIIFTVNSLIDPQNLSELENTTSWSNGTFVGTIIIGIVGSGLMTHGISIANSIAKSSLNNTAAGIIAGSIGAAGAAALSASKLGARFATDPVGGTAKAAATFADRFEQIKNGGSFADQFQQHREKLQKKRDEE